MGREVLGTGSMAPCHRRTNALKLLQSSSAMLGGVWALGFKMMAGDA